MSTVKELRKKALHKYSMHIGYSWLISIFGCLIAAGIVFVFSYFTSMLLLPFGLIVLPFLFSTICTHRALHFKKEPEAKRFFTYFRAFYSREFRSSFGYISSILKSILFIFVTYLICFPIIYNSFKATSATFEASVQTIAELAYNMNFTTEELNNILSSNNYELIHFFQVLIIPVACVEFLAMFFFLSVNSFSIFNRFEADKTRMPFAMGVSKVTIKRHRGEFYKYYFGLNWPMYLIIALAIGGASVLSYFLNNISIMPYTLVFPIGIAAMALFFPFYLNNNETIHEEFLPYYNESAKIMSDEILASLKQQQIFNDEQKEAIERALQNLKNQNETDINPNEDNEKDPPDSES